MLFIYYKMEYYNPSKADIDAYKHMIIQYGRGHDGYYVYNQDGDGLGNIFSSLVKNALPIIRKTIKAGAAIAKPHLKKAATDIVTAGSKRLIDKVSGDIINKIDSKPQQRRKRRRRI